MKATEELPSKGRIQYIFPFVPSEREISHSSGASLSGTSVENETRSILLP